MEKKVNINNIYIIEELINAREDIVKIQKIFLDKGKAIKEFARMSKTSIRIIDENNYIQNTSGNGQLRMRFFPLEDGFTGITYVNTISGGLGKLKR